MTAMMINATESPLGRFLFRKPRDPNSFLTLGADLGWTAPDTRILLVQCHINGFEPDSPKSYPLSVTFAMTRGPANDLAVALNREELALRDAGKMDGAWHVLIRRFDDHGFSVGRIPRNMGWAPQSEYDLPPGTLPDQYCRAAAHLEAKRHNRDLLMGGIPNRFQWALVIRPLVPSWSLEADRDDEQA